MGLSHTHIQRVFGWQPILLKSLGWKRESNIRWIGFSTMVRTPHLPLLSLIIFVKSWWYHPFNITFHINWISIKTNWMSCDGVSLKGYLHRLSEFQCGEYAFEHSTLAYALLFRAFGAFCLCCDVDWRRHNIIFLPILSTRLSFAFESILSAKIYMASKYLKEVHTIKPTNVITCNV